jgi:hypothetical protein
MVLQTVRKVITSRRDDLPRKLNDATGRAHLVRPEVRQ